jgi:hypothetical protein
VSEWWRRNWRWFLPVGALGAAGLVVVLAFFGVIALIVVVALATTRSSGACAAAIARAAADPAVVEALGSPLEEGWLVSGTLDPGRCAELTIPVSGPKGAATIEVKASCARCRRAIWPIDRERDAANEWVLSALAVGVRSTGRRITILEDEAPDTPACAAGQGLRRGLGTR